MWMHCVWLLLRLRKRTVWLQTGPSKTSKHNHTNNNMDLTLSCASFFLDSPVSGQTPKRLVPVTNRGGLLRLSPPTAGTATPVVTLKQHDVQATPKVVNWSQFAGMLTTPALVIKPIPTKKLSVCVPFGSETQGSWTTKIAVVTSTTPKQIQTANEEAPKTYASRPCTAASVLQHRQSHVRLVTLAGGETQAVGAARQISKRRLRVYGESREPERLHLRQRLSRSSVTPAFAEHEHDDGRWNALPTARLGYREKTPCLTKRNTTAPKPTTVRRPATTCPAVNRQTRSEVRKRPLSSCWPERNELNDIKQQDQEDSDDAPLTLFSRFFSEKLTRPHHLSVGQCQPSSARRRVHWSWWALVAADAMRTHEMMRVFLRPVLEAELMVRSEFGRCLTPNEVANVIVSASETLMSVQGKATQMSTDTPRCLSRLQPRSQW